jgi:sulfite oxidase
MSPGYRMPNSPVKPGEAVKPEDTHPVTGLNVKSLIASPLDGATVHSRNVQLQGVAWAGEADVVKVEISADGGKSWAAAQLGKEQAHYAWRLFHHQVKLPASGDFVLMSRATDSQGRVQPDSPVWNPSGYLNNAIDQVKVHVEG